MKLRGHLWSAQKPGWQPPARLLEILRQLHPRVRLVYSPGMRKWAMLQLVDGRWKWICAIDGLPNLRNTVHQLNELRMTSLEDVERLERGLDAQTSIQEAVMRSVAEDRLAEGHDRMWHELGTDHTVQVPRVKPWP